MYIKGEFTTLKRLIRSKSQQNTDILCEIAELKTLVEESRALKGNENIISFQQFCDVHNLQMPISNLEEFEAFDITLSEKGVIYQNLVRNNISNITIVKMII